MASKLQLELGTAPVAALGVVTDLVARLHSDPLGNRSILALLLSEHLLDSERLVGRLLGEKVRVSRAQDRE